MRRLFYSAFDE